MVTILAFNTGKAVVENAAVKISVDNLPHIRPEKAILLGKALIVDLFQLFKIGNISKVRVQSHFLGIMIHSYRSRVQKFRVHGLPKSEPLISEFKWRRH